MMNYAEESQSNVEVQKEASPEGGKALSANDENVR